MRAKHAIADKKGAAAIEFALMLPLLLLFFFGMIIFFNYFMVSRRIDMAANDISAIIAKEGRVAERSERTGVCNYDYNEFRGGRTTLDNTVQGLLPILIHPLNYPDGALIPITFNYQMVLAGLPLWSKIGTPPGNDFTSIKKIWQVNGGRDFGPTISGNAFSFSGISGSDLYRVENQGQSYVSFALEYPYAQPNGYFASLINGAELAGLFIKQGGIFDVNFSTFGPAFAVRRAAAYPVRPTSLNAAGTYVPYNDLNICTDCDVASNSLSPPCRRCDANCANDFRFDCNISGCFFD